MRATIAERVEASRVEAVARDSAVVASEEGRLVVPVCPVFALYVKRHAEAHDLLDPSFRRSLGLPEASGPAGPA